MSVRKTMTIEDRLFKLALQQWVEWLQLMRADTAQRRDMHRVSDKDLGQIGIWEVVCARARSNTEHSDSVLDQLLRDERRGWDWPAAVHAIVLDMPGTWQLALIGTGLDLTQAEIGEAVGISQQNVSTMMGLIKTRFIPRLKLLAATRRKCEAILGYKLPPLRAA